MQQRRHAGVELEQHVEEDAAVALVRGRRELLDHRLGAVLARPRQHGDVRLPVLELAGQLRRQHAKHFQPGQATERQLQRALALRLFQLAFAVSDARHDPAHHGCLSVVRRIFGDRGEVADDLRDLTGVDRHVQPLEEVVS